MKSSSSVFFKLIIFSNLGDLLIEKDVNGKVSSANLNYQKGLQ